MTFSSASQFNSVLNLTAIVGTFNQKEALVGTFFIIVKNYGSFAALVATLSLGDVSHGSGAIQPPQVGGTSSWSPGDHVTNVAVMSPRSTDTGSSRGIIHISINKQSHSATQSISFMAKLDIAYPGRILSNQLHRYKDIFTDLLIEVHTKGHMRLS